MSQTERAQSTVHGIIAIRLVRKSGEVIITLILRRALAISVCMPLLLRPIPRRRRFRVLNDIIIP